MQKPLDSARIIELFEGIGRRIYATPDMTQTDHALHCATRAEHAGEGIDLIVAALLHDIGHMLAAGVHQQSGWHVDQSTLPAANARDVGGGEMVAAKRAARKLSLVALQGWLPDNAVAAVRLLHPAKRYLCAVEDDYWEKLTSATQVELLAEGGPYDAALVARFRQYPCHAAAVRLRRYDDLAKQNTIAVRPLSHFVQYLQRYVRQDVYAVAFSGPENLPACPVPRVTETDTTPSCLAPTFHVPAPRWMRSGANG